MKSLGNPYAFFMRIRANYKIRVPMNSSRSVETRSIVLFREATMTVDIPAESDAHPDLDLAVLDRAVETEAPLDYDS
jgi:hypothetical protein